MKKLLILLFSLLISFNSNGKVLDSLFDITLNDNAEKYFSSNYINSNKRKNHETLDGFYNLDITDKIKTKNPYFSNYLLTLDMNNNIHSIDGYENYSEINRCLEFLETLTSSLEERYDIDFEYEETFFPNGVRYEYSSLMNSDSGFVTQCNEEDKQSHLMIIYLETRELSDARTKFYDSGL